MKRRVLLVDEFLRKNLPQKMAQGARRPNRAPIPQARAFLEPHAVRRIRALAMLGIGYPAICAAVDAPRHTVADIANFRSYRAAGEPSDDEILSAAEFIAKRVIRLRREARKVAA